MLYEALRPVFFCSFSCGMTPFSIKGRKFGESKLALMWSATVLIICGTLTAIAFSSRSFVHNKILIYSITDFMQAWLSVINVVGIIVSGCFHRKKILHLIAEFEAMDHDFEKLNLVQNLTETHKRLKLKIMAATAFTTLFIIYVLVFDGLTYGKPYVNAIVVGDFLTYWTPIFCTSYLVLQFCAFVTILKERFEWLNNQLKKLAFLSNKHASINRNKLANPYFISPISDDVFNTNIAQKLKTIQAKHKLLCTMCASLNTIYSLQFLTTVGEIFFTYLSIIFFWLHKELLSEWATKIMKTRTYFFYTGGLLALHATQVVALILFSSKTAREASRSGNLLHDINSSSWNVESQILNFSGQLVHCKVEFTACKIFVIDETLLYAMISATTTYLVIVLQFEIAMGNGT